MPSKSDVALFTVLLVSVMHVVQLDFKICSTFCSLSLAIMSQTIIQPHLSLKSNCKLQSGLAYTHINLAPWDNSQWTPWWSSVLGVLPGTWIQLCSVVFFHQSSLWGETTFRNSEAGGVNPNIWGFKGSSRCYTRMEDLLYHRVGLDHTTLAM